MKTRYAFSFKSAQGFGILLLLVAMAFASPLRAEYGSAAAVKAAFLYNFFIFIDWPEAVARNNSMQLCVVGESSLKSGLSVLENKTIGNKPLTVKYNVKGDLLRACQIVFVDAEQNPMEIVRSLKGLPIVTVSDKNAFMEQGGMIGFVENDNRLGFEINLDVAQASDIHISARLLKLARTIKADNRR